MTKKVGDDEASGGNIQHDRLFKKVFGNKEEAEALIRPIFPEHIAKDIDFASLALEQGNHISDSLKLAMPDLVFTLTYKAHFTLRLVLLAEHKSDLPDQDDPIEIQLLSYLVAHYLKNKEAYQKKPAPKGKFQLDLVIPIVVYHGIRGWRARTIEEMTADERLPDWFRQFVPQVNYLLHDLHKMTDQEVRLHYRQSIPAQTVSLLMKHSRDEDLYHQVENIFQNAQELSKTARGRSYLSAIGVYLSQALKKKELFLNAGVKIKRIDNQTGETIMSAYDEAIAEGKTIGIAEGKTIGIAEGEVKNAKKVALKMLQAGKSDEEILAFTEISLADLNALKQQLRKRNY